MKWDNEDLYIRLQTATSSVKCHLGLSCLKWFLSENGELDPYIIVILEYINFELIKSGASTVFQKLTEFSEIYKKGTDKIINGDINSLIFEIGITSDFPNYQETLFSLTWGNLMTSLYVSLQYNYSGVYNLPEPDCHTQCNCSDITSGIELGSNNSVSWETDKFGCGCGK